MTNKVSNNFQHLLFRSNRWLLISSCSDWSAVGQDPSDTRCTSKTGSAGGRSGRNWRRSQKIIIILEWIQSAVCQQLCPQPHQHNRAYITLLSPAPHKNNTAMSLIAIDAQFCKSFWNNCAKRGVRKRILSCKSMCQTSGSLAHTTTERFQRTGRDRTGSP